MHRILTVDAYVYDETNKITGNKCTCLNTDNTRYEVTLSPEEVDLYFTLKSIEQELGQIKTDRLRDKIVKYAAQLRKSTQRDDSFAHLSKCINDAKIDAEKTIIDNPEAAEQFKTKYFRKDGLLSYMFDLYKNIPSELKPVIGDELNKLRSMLENKY